jgi:hypothetical protein
MDEGEISNSLAIIRYVVFSYPCFLNNRTAVCRILSFGPPDDISFFRNAYTPNFKLKAGNFLSVLPACLAISKVLTGKEVIFVLLFTGAPMNNLDFFRKRPHSIKYRLTIFTGCFDFLI